MELTRAILFACICLSIFCSSFHIHLASFAYTLWICFYILIEVYFVFFILPCIQRTNFRTNNEKVIQNTQMHSERLLPRPHYIFFSPNGNYFGFKVFAALNAVSEFPRSSHYVDFRSDLIYSI